MSEPKKMALIASKGTLDWAYPPFILASTAAAMDMEVSVFFTFYGLTLLKKDIKAKVAPATNPAMPMKMPFGPQGFQNIEWPMPNVLMGNVPGFETMATSMMKQTFKNKRLRLPNRTFYDKGEVFLDMWTRVKSLTSVVKVNSTFNGLFFGRIKMGS